MCLGMNDDQLSSGERCASTSNRNFEGRQGAPRTHLVSPAMSAASAVAAASSTFAALEYHGTVAARFRSKGSRPLEQGWDERCPRGRHHGEVKRL